MDVQTVVVGAGVVGLAAARALTAAGREVVVLERAASPGTQTSSRNSGVIHAGIYPRRDCACAARSCSTNIARAAASLIGAAVS